MSAEDDIKVKTEIRMDELRIQALVNLLAKEGVISRDDFEQELESLCKKE